MSSITESFKKQLTNLTVSRMGIDVSLLDQGSDEWMKCRLGVISASRAKDLIATGRGGKGVGEARNTYRRQLVAEVATGQQKDQVRSKPTEWGHEHEDTAREIFAFDMGLKVETIPFVYGDNSMRYGCSPDGLADDKSGLEIKNPFDTVNFLNFILDGEADPKYLCQCQFSMFVTGLPYWHLAMYDGRMRKKAFHAITIERDEALMSTFKDAVGQMVFDMDSDLARLGFKFGDQWEKPVELEQAA